MERKQRWQDWVILILGIWLFFSPFFLGYVSTIGAAAWNSYIFGAVAAIFAISALAKPETKVPDWFNLVLGAWLIISPFVLGLYAVQAVATWNLIVVGILIGGDAIWAVAQRPAIGTHAPHH